MIQFPTRWANIEPVQPMGENPNSSQARDPSQKNWIHMIRGNRMTKENGCMYIKTYTCTIGSTCMKAPIFRKMENLVRLYKYESWTVWQHIVWKCFRSWWKPGELRLVCSACKITCESCKQNQTSIHKQYNVGGIQMSDGADLTSQKCKPTFFSCPIKLLKGLGLGAANTNQGKLPFQN